jgi:phosphatidyl-myo-inositol dimannoside synthase
MPESWNRLRKVLILAPPLGGIGGVQTYTSVVFRGLKDLLGPENVRMVAVPEEADVQENGQRALRSTVKLRFLTSSVSAAVAWRPDLVICLHLGTARAALVAQRLIGVPYWLVLHGIEVWCTLSESKLKALRGAERYIALTHFTFDTTVARHFNSAPPPLILLPPPVDFAAHSSNGNTPSASANPPVVLTVSRVGARDRYKGHGVMLDAWPTVLRRVPNAQYWIVGDGDDLPRLKGKARELGIADSVRFTGAISNEELAGTYDRCSVYAMPAQTDLNPAAPRGEGFGIVYVEALARGKPVIAPRSGAPAEYIRQGEYGLLVDPESSADVAQALIKLLEDPEKARAMGQAGQRWVKQELSYEKFCATLRDALNNEPLRH